MWQGRIRLGPTMMIAAAILSGCGTSDEDHRDLEAACQDNRERAYEAAGKARLDGDVTKDEALKHMRTYIEEVSKVPGCFAKPLREEVERAADAAERGQVLELEYPTFIQ